MIKDKPNNELRKQLIFLFKCVYKSDKLLIFSVLFTSIFTALAESFFITYTSSILSNQIENLNTINLNQFTVPNKGISLILLAFAITIIRLVYLRQLAHARRQTSIIIANYLIKSFLYDKYETWVLKSFDEFSNLFLVQTRRVAKAFAGFYNVISNAVVILLILTTGFIKAPLLSIFSFSIIPIIYLILGKRYKPLLNKLSFGIDSTELNKIEIIKNSYFLKESIICDEAEKIYENNFNKEEKRNRDFEFKHTVIDASPKIILEGACFSLIGLVFIYQIIFSYKLNIQELIIFALVLQRSIPLIQMIFSQWNAFQTNIKQIDDIYYAIINLSRPKHYFLKRNFKNQIELKNIFYQEILTDINITINSGDKIALVGESGSGKTTLAKLISGIIKPTSGLLYIDNKQLSTSEAKEYTKYISSTSFCSYKPYLTRGGLLENVAMKNKVSKYEIKRIKKITKALEIYSFWEVKDLSSMSGGERQRVAIARVIFKKSDLVILDEITSSLDVVKSKDVLNYIFEELQDSTIILITHKSLEAKLCNKTFKVNNGALK